MFQGRYQQHDIDHKTRQVQMLPHTSTFISKHPPVTSCPQLPSRGSPPQATSGLLRWQRSNMAALLLPNPTLVARWAASHWEAALHGLGSLISQREPHGLPLTNHGNQTPQASKLGASCRPQRKACD